MSMFFHCFDKRHSVMSCHDVTNVEYPEPEEQGLFVVEQRIKVPPDPSPSRPYPATAPPAPSPASKDSQDPNHNSSIR